MLGTKGLPPPAATSTRSTGSAKRLGAAFALLLVGLIQFSAPRWWHSDRLEAVLNPRAGSIYWSPCPDHVGSYCGFLNVPLDYINPRANETVSLALRMLPATAPANDQLGYLFMNPGGPGGSGTGALVDLGPYLAPIYEGRYNLISWDPRGVNLTAPALGCFPTVGDANRFTQARGSPSLGFDSAAANASELMWTTKLDRFALALVQGCGANGNQGMLRASSTAFTSRDTKSIAEALGEEKVNYWGFSYGTIVGATFAAMFPELVGRFILDGVSDADSYGNNMWDWGRSGMVDTRKTFEGFFTHCARSGPAGCEFAKEESTAEEIEGRYDALLNSLRESPLPVGTSDVGPGTLTASDVQYTMFHALYQPSHWPQLAHLLSLTASGDGSQLYSLSNAFSAKLGRKNPTGGRHSPNPFHRAMQSFMTSSATIMCGDTDSEVLGQASGVRGLRDFMQDLRRTTKSPTADVWSIWISTCRHWKVKAIETYRGPWTVETGLKQTSNPMLFFSQTADPVTPLRSAQKMVTGFGNDSARLLVQNGYGHCSIAHPSLCTAKAYRAYLLEGVLPAPDTRCDGDPAFLFPHVGETEEALQALSKEDQELSKALGELARRGGKYRLGPH
ncbi:hypothetical protein JCM11641_004110 [Rhodosporidiobolus odoratus]